jgi:hypothetical protein
MEFKITPASKKAIRDCVFLDIEYELPLTNIEYLFKVIKRLSKEFPNDSELGQVVRNYVNQDVFNEN